MSRSPLEGVPMEQSQLTDESSNLLSHRNVQHDDRSHEPNFDHDEKSEHDRQSMAMGTDTVNALQEYFGYLERGANVLDENRLLKLQLPKQISVRNCCSSVCMHVFIASI
jgi:hypothetical protein